MDLKPVGTLLCAAGTVVGIVFGLFGSVLQGLVPPSRALEPTLYAGIASFASLVILLTIVLAMPARLTLRQRRWVAAFTLVVGVAALCSLLLYATNLNTYVFRHPESAPLGGTPQRYIRGEYTEFGREITKVITVGAAIDAIGGIEMVRKNQLLWTEQSEKATEMRLVVHYVLSLALLTAALFSLAVAVLRLRTGRMRAAEAPRTD